MKKDRYVSELNKTTLYYNIVFHLKKCKNDEERCDVIKRILNNFEMKNVLSISTKDDLNEIINEDTCVCCGRTIPEGRQICLDCSEKIISQLENK